jgi:hypothetical protein
LVINQVDLNQKKKVKAEERNLIAPREWWWGRMYLGWQQHGTAKAPASADISFNLFSFYFMSLVLESYCPLPNTNPLI